MFFTPRLLASLDKCMISDRDAIHVLSATALALGHDVSDLILNRTSLWKYRRDNRVSIATEKQESYQVFVQS